MNGFIKEVCTQSRLLREVTDFYQNDGAGLIDGIAREFRQKKMERIIFTGMGSSLYAMDSVLSYLTGHGIRALSFSSFELSRFQFGQIDEKTLIVAVSQSGNSMEVVELAEKAKKVTTVVGLYNNEGAG